MSKTRKMTSIALFTAIAIVLNLMENMMALPFGIRVGFANIIAMTVINLYGWREMIFVNFLRVFLSGLLSGILFSYPWWMSACGVLFSSISLILLHHHASAIFTGIICAFAHDIGQIFVLSLFLATSAFIAYLPIMFICSIISGVFTGIVSAKIVTRLSNK